MIASKPYKNSTPVNARPAERPVTWPEVLRALDGAGVRPIALAHYFGLGFTADIFASSSRRARPARAAMADTLTRVEDRLETEQPRRSRSALRAIRRRLELE